MKSKLIFSLVIIALVPTLMFTQPIIPPFHVHHDFLMASPGAFKYGLYGYDNPAILRYVHQPDIYFTWSDRDGSFGDFSRWGLFAAIPNFGFGIIQHDTDVGSITDYRVSSAFGNRAFSAGIGYGWSGGDGDIFSRERLLSLGILMRPNRYVSIGAVGYQTLRGKRQEVYTDLALRPFGNETLTLFADIAVQTDQTLRDGTWSAGLAVEPLPGIRVIGRAFEDNQFTLGFSFNFRRLGVSAQSRIERDSGTMYSTYGIRLGAYDRTFFDRHPLSRNRYVTLTLYGRLKYQQYRLLDSAPTLHDVLTTIEQAQDDPAVAGIVINLSGFSASHAMKWELRNALQTFQKSGKQVIIYIDRGNITDYHLASVADYLIMDPLGTITLEGFITGSTYLRGLFDNLGIGVEEWRFFEYKSAFESLARDTMSAADREQRQRLIDHSYELVMRDVMDARGLTEEEFERLVNEVGIFLSDEALRWGLVDTLARWDKVRDIVKELENGTKMFVRPGRLTARNQPFDDRWGEPPQIALIYALGVCAMDEGIRARRLVQDVRRAARNDNVKAIVFRVDSPGGDALASDIVAEALKDAMEKKPVVVSQGTVAASGGYWLSMYSNRIIAAPNTITGSIGVIGGWIYNNGFKERLGLSTDFVKRGTFADLGFGATLPLLNIQLPDRNLTEREFELMQERILKLYDGFVNRVAEGRGVDQDEIEPLAQGRVWSGLDALDRGLIDDIGSLTDAIRIARELAGIKLHEEITIVEYPRPGLLDPRIFIPRLFGVEISQRDPIVEHIAFRARYNGHPLPLIPLEYIDLELLNDLQ